MEIEEIQGKKMMAKYVYAESIRAIKDELLLRLQETGKVANVDEIRWVLTVPAIWHDNAKLFMKDCAVQVNLVISSFFIQSAIVLSFYFLLMFKYHK